MGSNNYNRRMMDSGVLVAVIVGGIGGVGGIASSAMAQGGQPPPLPPAQFPAQNPFSEPKRVLGKILFWDEQLSSDNTISCATCHILSSGGTDPRRVGHPGVDGVFQTPDDVFASPGVIRQDSAENYTASTAFGVRAQVTNRSAQSVINSAFTPLAFWDGRATGTFINPETGAVSIPNGGALESQIVGPPVSDVEMAHTARSWAEINAKLATAAPLALATALPADVQTAILNNPTYPALFQQAFGSPVITGERIAFAIATYERTLVSNQTDWDRFRDGNQTALTPQEQQGLQVFQARCAVCHTPPLFSNNTFRNLGLTAPGDDPGRQSVTGNPGDGRRFKVPTLRNAALKASFMHTGEFTTLAQVMNFYPNGGVQFPQNRDPLMPIPLNQQDRNNIAAFIAGGLVDPRVQNRQFPFDQPTLFTQRPNTNLVPLPGTGAPGVGGQVPGWIAVVPPNVGNAGFKVGVQNALAGATATLRISRSAPVGGIVAADEVVGPMALSTTLGAAQGFGTGHWPIPNSPVYAGRVYFMQWFVNDPAAVGGVARSEAMRVTIFGSPLRCPADINGDNTSTSQDYFDFLAMFFTLDEGADFNQSGDVTSQDYFDFLSVFLTGC